MMSQSAHTVTIRAKSKESVLSKREIAKGEESSQEPKEGSSKICEKRKQRKGEYVGNRRKMEGKGS